MRQRPSQVAPGLGRRAMLSSLAALSWFGLAPRARAQAQTRPDPQGATYPERPIRVIVPFTPGGVPDLQVRLVAPKMQQLLGQPLVIFNRPGAATVIGASDAARAAPDGYTLLFGSATSLVISPLMLPNVPYDPVRDFVPVGFHGSNAAVIVVHPSTSFETIGELVAFIRQNPGKLEYGSPGIGTAAHLAGESFRQTLSLELPHIGYKGATAAEQDLIGGQIKLVFTNLGSALPHIRAGHMRPLAVTTLKRSQLATQVPTLAETVIPEFDVAGWGAFVAPRGTPADIVQRLNTALNAALAEPDVRARLADVGVDVDPGPPEALARRIKSETEKLGRVIRTANLKPE